MIHRAERIAVRIVRKTMALVPCLLLFFFFGHGFAATDVKTTFTLNTADASGKPMVQSRSYFVYRPDNLPKTTTVPMVLCMSDPPKSDSLTVFHRMADRAGFVLVFCSLAGNSKKGAGWVNGDPRIVGFEDHDYTSAVIDRVTKSDNCSDAFIFGLSRAGHMALAYACVRPDKIKAACTVDEFMGLTSNIPSAPVPVIAFQGTSDSAVPYAMVKDTVDAWRAVNGLFGATPVTTYESSPLIPGRVTQATWKGGVGGTQVAFVTIVGGFHQYALPGVNTGYDCTAGMWAFFSQFVTSTQAAPKIVSAPVDNIQVAGQPASFWVAATGKGSLSYQWQKNGANIPGATSNWYTTPPTTMADNGATFRAIVTNGTDTATSGDATLTVNAAPPGPTITTQPVDHAVTAGRPVSFSVTATGAEPLSYQWQQNGANIVGATASSLTLPATLTADCGATFRAVITNSAGSVISNAATLTAIPAPGCPTIVTNPARARVLANQTATFSVNARSATPMSYQWQKGTRSGNHNLVNIEGATDSTYTIPSPTLADNSTLFRCVVSNEAGNATSAIELLMVTAAGTLP